ncbi:MAG: hypothetical protein IKE70_01540 [Bacilli bacterium]|nr:hypothetical protein [Bacilli bacterium]
MINQNKKMNLREKDKRGKMVIAILLLIAIIGVGYAALGANLKINGVANIPSASWDVHFKTGSIAVTSGSVTGTNVTTAATITNATQVNYAVKLALPGDFYEFTVTAENTGTIDAMIDSVVSKRADVVITTGTLPSYIDYSVTYSDGTAIATHHLLAASTEETYKVRIAYKTDIEANELPTTAETLNLNFQINYVQADSDAITVEHPVILYGVYGDYNGSYTELNQPVPNDITFRSTPSEAINDWTLFFNEDPPYPLYLKHKVINDIIRESYLGFVISDADAVADSNLTAGTYAVRGGVDESSLAEKLIFEANKAVLLSAYGSANCTDDSTSFSCGNYNSTSRGYSISVNDEGFVGFSDGWHCTIDSGTGWANCSWQ